LANECKTIKEKLVIWTLLDTGLRIEEFCSIEKKSIDWTNHTITVWGKNTKGGPKKQRMVRITDRIRPLIEPWIAQNDRVGFTVKTGWAIVKRVANRCAIGKCSPHVLRHTFAVISLERGVSLPSLQKILGHENLETTAIYLNKSNAEAVREYAEKF
jgi:integrase/recombinase XerD